MFRNKKQIASAVVSSIRWIDLLDEYSIVSLFLRDSDTSSFNFYSDDVFSKKDIIHILTTLQHPSVISFVEIEMNANKIIIAIDGTQLGRSNQVKLIIEEPLFSTYANEIQELVLAYQAYQQAAKTSFLLGLKDRGSSLFSLAQNRLFDKNTLPFILQFFNHATTERPANVRENKNVNLDAADCKSSTQSKSLEKLPRKDYLKLNKNEIFQILLNWLEQSKQKLQESAKSIFVTNLNKEAFQAICLELSGLISFLNFNLKTEDYGVTLQVITQGIAQIPKIKNCPNKLKDEINKILEGLTLRFPNDYCTAITRLIGNREKVISNQAR